MFFIQFVVEVFFVAASQEFGDEAIRRFELKEHFFAFAVKDHIAFVFDGFQFFFEFAEGQVFQERRALQRVGVRRVVSGGDVVQFAFAVLAARRHLDEADQGFAQSFFDDVHVVGVGDFKEEGVVGVGAEEVFVLLAMCAR